MFYLEQMVRMRLEELARERARPCEFQRPEPRGRLRAHLAQFLVAAGARLDPAAALGELGTSAPKDEMENAA